MDLVLIRYCCTHAPPDCSSRNGNPEPHCLWTLSTLTEAPKSISQSPPFPSVWAHPKPRTPCDILGGLQSNTRSLGLCYQTPTPTPTSQRQLRTSGRTFLRRKPSTSALSTLLHTYTTSTCITVLSVANTCCGRSARHIAVEEPDTCIALFVSNRQTDILEVPSGSGSIVHPDASLIRGIGLDLVCWSLRLRDQSEEPRQRRIGMESDASTRSIATVARNSAPCHTIVVPKGP
jgi:hypothetical protein